MPAARQTDFETTSDRVLKQQHTVIFVPHARAKFRKWRFTTLQACLVLGTLALLSVGGSVATVLYFTTNFDRHLLDEIEQENAELRQENQGFERSIRDLGGDLADFQQQIHKLAIVAGVSELAPATEGGIGGPLAVDGGMDENLSLLESDVDVLGRSVSLLQQRFDERRLLISRTPAVTPVKGLLTSRFGYRPDPFDKDKRRTFHGGIDITAPRGKKVRATGDALVIKTGRLRGLGNAVYLSHGYGITTRYGHLLKILVEEGQQVKRGDVVGQVGNTGRSTGNHLHYEVRVDGRATNPLGYILDSTSP